MLAGGQGPYRVLKLTLALMPDGWSIKKTLKRPAQAEKVRWLVVEFPDQRLERLSGRAEGKALGRTLPDIGNTGCGHTGLDAGLRSVSIKMALSFKTALPSQIRLSLNYTPTPWMKTAQKQH